MSLRAHAKPLDLYWNDMPKFAFQQQTSGRKKKEPESIKKGKRSDIKSEIVKKRSESESESVKKKREREKKEKGVEASVKKGKGREGIKEKSKKKGKGATVRVTEILVDQGKNNKLTTALFRHQQRLRDKTSSCQDITAYLTMFERVAQLLKVEEDTLAVRLVSLLIGMAAERYFTFDTTTISNFSDLKQASLYGFYETSMHYNQDYRNQKIRVGENYRQISACLLQLFAS